MRRTAECLITRSNSYDNVLVNIFSSNKVLSLPDRVTGQINKANFILNKNC